MYQDLLGRTPSQSEVHDWVILPVPPIEVAHGFAASAEREGQRITADYQTYLGRTPSAAEVDAWTNAFLHGVSNEDVVAGFVGSPEYFAEHYGNAPDWIFNAYQDLLGRQPDPAGEEGWVMILGNA
jgi:hypothetical protein